MQRRKYQIDSYDRIIPAVQPSDPTSLLPVLEVRRQSEPQVGPTESKQEMISGQASRFCPSSILSYNLLVRDGPKESYPPSRWR